MLLKYNIKKYVIARSRRRRGTLLFLDCFALLAMTILPLKTLAQEYVPPPLFETPSYIPAETMPAPKPELKPKPKPKPLLKRDIPPPPASNGVVKGPKTMPSAPMKSVESEVLYELPKQQVAPLIINFQKKSSPILEEPEFVPPLPAFKNLSEDMIQSTLYFVSVTESLSETNKTTLKHLIIPELKKNDNKRLLIQAFAAPQEDVLSGDRRIALSRALNVRRFLIDQGISPSRLDVRALGAQTNTQPLDRVELIII